MSVDLSKLSIQELQAFIQQASARIVEVQRTERANLRHNLSEQARQAGYDINELFATRGGAAAGQAAKSTNPAPIKFRNPANAQQTWSGRGKRPHWFRDGLAAGKTESDFAAE